MHLMHQNTIIVQTGPSSIANWSDRYQQCMKKYWFSQNQSQNIVTLHHVDTWYMIYNIEKDKLYTSPITWTGRNHQPNIILSIIWWKFNNNVLSICILPKRYTKIQKVVVINGLSLFNSLIFVTGWIGAEYISS